MGHLLSHEEGSEIILQWHCYCTGQRSRWFLKASFISAGQLHGRVTFEHHLATPIQVSWSPALPVRRC